MPLACVFAYDSDPYAVTSIGPMFLSCVFSRSPSRIVYINWLEPRKFWTTTMHWLSLARTDAPRHRHSTYFPVSILSPFCSRGAQTIYIN